jgi:hypothetical protein
MLLSLPPPRAPLLLVLPQTPLLLLLWALLFV